MAKTFEEVFNEIKNLEIQNKKKLNRAEQDSKNAIEVCNEQKNAERIEKIKVISLEIDKYYSDEKQKIDENIKAQKVLIDNQMIEMKNNFEKNQSEAVKVLFNEFIN